MANKTRSINLLPGKEGGFVTQFLNWSLTIGRLLIILVETLALGTFLYRFNLDMKIIDLHDQIKAENFIVSNFAQQEEEFRNLQARLSMAKAYGETNPTVTIFRDITEMGRSKVTFKNVLVTLESVRIEAEAPSSDLLSQFTDALQAYPSIAEVTVDKVENKTSTASISITISAKLQKNPALSTQTVLPAVNNPTELIP